jgi:hypothetical protein
MAGLGNHWKLEEYKLGETNFMHFADGTAHKNRMQGNDFVQSVMYHADMTDDYKMPTPCTDCHKDKNTSWARESLRGWTNESRWRVE